jgi:hypothetical protein
MRAREGQIRLYYIEWPAFLNQAKPPVKVDNERRIDIWHESNEAI